MIKRVSHLEVGKLGEQFAAKYLRKKGYNIYARNWTCSVGEIDLIAVEEDELVFVEVKTRLKSVNAENYLLDNINRKKKLKLSTLANIYLKQKRITDKKHRFDVLGVLIKPEDFKPHSYRHLVGVIEQRRW